MQEVPRLDQEQKSHILHVSVWIHWGYLMNLLLCVHVQCACYRSNPCLPLTIITTDQAML